MDRIKLPDTDEELLAECDVETFRAGGKGGQHVNTTDSAVRLRHRPSGVVATSQQERSQHRNKEICLQNLRKKIEKLNYRAPKRVPTRLPARARAKNMIEKTRLSEKKRARAKVTSED